MPSEDLDKIFDDMSKDLGYTKKMISSCVQHVCNWTRQSLINLDYSQINWFKFGSFMPMVSRLNKENYTDSLKDAADVVLEHRKSKKIESIKLRKQLKLNKANGIQSTNDESNDKQCSEDNK
jgi:hypothetical protein